MNSFLLPSSATLVTRILDNKNATEPMIEADSRKLAFSSERQGTKLVRCTPEEEGIPSELLCEYLQKISRDSSLNMHNILILRNGRIVCEASFGAQRSDVWKYTFSACKSIVSLAIGMLIDDGLLSVDDRIADIFPKEIGAITKLKLKDLRVDDVLTMRASLQFAEGDCMTTTEWVKEFLNSATKGEIGKTFRYNSLNTYLLAAIVVRKTGKSLSEFLDKRLFAPLGIVNYYWEKSPQNIEKGGWGLYLLAEDFAKIGHMVLSHGVYEGKRIVSSEYLNSACFGHVDVQKESETFNYGYQIWVGKKNDVFLFNGMLGQNVFGFKKSGVVVVANAGNGEFFQTGNFFDYTLDLFDRVISPTLPKNNREYKNLQKTIRALSLYYPQKISVRDRLIALFSLRKNMFDSIVGDYRFSKGEPNAVGLMPLILQAVQNQYTKGFVSVSFYQKDNIPYLLYCEKNQKYEIPLGFKTPICKHYSFGKLDYLVASCAKFKHDEYDRLVLMVRLDFMETPCSRILKFVFTHEGGLLIYHEEAPGEAFVSEAVSVFLQELSQVSMPLLAGMINRFGEDYMELKLNKILSPKLELVKNQISDEK